MSRRKFIPFILPGESRRRQLFYLTKSKLGVVAQFAAFMAGFAIRSVANLQINPDPSIPLLTAYAIITTILTVLASFVILVTLWIMPLLYVAEQINSEIATLLEEATPEQIAAFDLQRFSKLVNGDSVTSRRHAQTTTFGLKTYRGHRLTILMIEASWITVGAIATFLFMLDTIVMHWIKYERFSVTAPLIGTVMLICAMVGLVFVAIYFRAFVVNKFTTVTVTEQRRLRGRGQMSDPEDPRAVVWWPNHNVPSISSEDIAVQDV